MSGIGASFAAAHLLGKGKEDGLLGHGWNTDQTRDWIVQTRISRAHFFPNRWFIRVPSVAK